MNRIPNKQLLGREVICPDGVGRIVGFELTKDGGTIQRVKVDTYVKNRGCAWAPENIRLIKINCED